MIGDDLEVFGTELIADDVNLISIDKLTAPIKVKAKIRYSGKETDAVVYPERDGEVRVVFKEKVRAITRGQSVVFYDGDILVGGGSIVKKIK